MVEEDEDEAGSKMAAPPPPAQPVALREATWRLAADMAGAG